MGPTVAYKHGTGTTTVTTARRRHQCFTRQKVQIGKRRLQLVAAIGMPSNNTSTNKGRTGSNTVQSKRKQYDERKQYRLRGRLRQLPTHTNDINGGTTTTTITMPTPTFPLLLQSPAYLYASTTTTRGTSHAKKRAFWTSQTS